MNALLNDVSLMLVHVAALSGAVVLLRSAPDWLQRVVLCLFIVATIAYIGADLVVLSGEKRAWVVRVIASRIEHSAFLIYIFRQVWIGTGVCRYLKSLH